MSSSDIIPIHLHTYTGASANCEVSFCLCNIFVNMFYSVHIILQLALSRIFISFISLNTCITLHTHIVNVAFPVIRYLYFQQFFQLQVTAI